MCPRLIIGGVRYVAQVRRGEETFIPASGKSSMQYFLLNTALGAHRVISINSCTQWSLLLKQVISYSKLSSIMKSKFHLSNNGFRNSFILTE